MDSRAATDRPMQPDPALLLRIRSEFLEMPGLRLTLWQASRLWGVDAETCRRAIERLTAQGFLRVTRDGQYACHCHGPN